MVSITKDNYLQVTFFDNSTHPNPAGKLCGLRDTITDVLRDMAYNAISDPENNKLNAGDVYNLTLLMEALQPEPLQIAEIEGLQPKHGIQS